MTNKTSIVNIKIDKLVTNRIRHHDSTHDVIKYFKRIIKPEFNIVDLYNEDPELIKTLSSILNKDALLISYFLNPGNTIKNRKSIDKKNVLMINSMFSANDLKSYSADLVVANNILSVQDNHEEFREINRVLKPEGYFLFRESLSLDKISDIANKLLIKSNNNIYYEVFNYFGSKIRLIKSVELNIEINGYGNFIYLNRGGVHKLHDFCQFIQEKMLKSSIVIKDFSLVVHGRRGLKREFTLIMK